MPLVNMKDMVGHAYRHNYAVGAFKLVSLEFLQGVVAAAERCRAPVILSLADSSPGPADFDLLASGAECAARRASVPIAIDFHHHGDLRSLASAIGKGCNGVTVDASPRELGAHIALTREVVGVARGCGVPVEGVSGHVPLGEQGSPQSDSNRPAYTSVAEARGYVERTGVDFLAVSIGTVRGHAKGKLKLDWSRLKQINEALDIPLTIRGGTGLNNSQFRRLIENGIAKIGYYTGLADAALRQVRASAKGGSAKDDYTVIMCAVRDAVEQETERCLKLWGAAGRAAEVLEQCEHWVPVEHVVTHDVTGLDDRGVEALISEGRRVLGALPGVLDVCSGQAVRDNALYRIHWLVRFCHAAAVTGYRTDPAYVAFANQRFIAGHRTAVDARLTARRGSLDFPDSPLRPVSQAWRG